MKTLALDLGGVCIRIFPERAFQALGVPPNTPVPAPISDCYRRYSCGLLSNEQFCHELRKLTSFRLSEAMIYDAWCSFLGDEIIQTTQLVSELLSRGWTIAWLSDIQPWHLDLVLKRLSYASQMPHGIYSFEIGAEKPSPLMYEAFEQKFGKPSLYLDDRLDNIEGARKRGWNAIQYCENKQLSSLVGQLLQDCRAIELKEDCIAGS